MGKAHWRWFAVVSLAGSALLGCHKHIPVATAELPKLSGAFSWAPHTHGLTTVRVFHIASPSGRIVEIKGEFDLELQMVNGQTLHFDYPVVIESVNGALLIAGANRGRTPVEPGGIEVATVKQLDGTASVFGVLVAVATPLTIALIAL